MTLEDKALNWLRHATSLASGERASVFMHTDIADYSTGHREVERVASIVVGAVCWLGRDVDPQVAAEKAWRKWLRG